MTALFSSLFAAPFPAVVTVAVVISAFCWIASLISRDTSWVDRIWSIAPVVYLWIFAGYAGFADLRLTVMAVLVTLWGARLTFNFARKGGYSGTEDYRWAVLRSRMPAGAFQVFNLFFIVLYQNALLVLITLPAFTAFERQSPFAPFDGLFAALFLVFLLGETIADQQQWNFHRAKKAAAAQGDSVHPRFLTTGLFRYSRHPNFFFEQAQWWAIAAFGVVAAGTLTWSIAGALFLTALFIGSTRFTESITLSKYPEYARYQAGTSPIIPWFSRLP